MSVPIKSLKLNKKNKKLYQILSSVVFFLFSLLFVFMLHRIVFSSGYFNYPVDNTGSLLNAVTDLKLSDQDTTFFASTPLIFSQVKIKIELTTKNNPLKNKTISVKKGYKSFFYPLGENLKDLNGKEENQLISVDNSIFIIGNKQKTPINNPLTFTNFGYNWDNVKNNKIDLSVFEKQKVADLTTPHPAGTAFKSLPDNKYYFIEDFTKREIIDSENNDLTNVIEVNSESLDKTATCVLEKSFLSSKKYTCTLGLESINYLTGKDYKFILDTMPTNLQIRKINLEFKKVPNQENFKFFLGDLKQKILYRFGLTEF